MKIMIIFGTRPEAIKLAPVIWECRKNAKIEPIVYFTGQHKQTLLSHLEDLDIRPDIVDDVLRERTLAELTGLLFNVITKHIQEVKPDYVIVQGDTQTAVVASLVAFYCRVPVAHVEAGLRTYDYNSPYPEELNRTVISVVANKHCAPTTQAANNLLAEGRSATTVKITGNTIVDALQSLSNPEASKPAVLITIHRRENHSQIGPICEAILQLANEFSGLEWIIPVHPNPAVKEPMIAVLQAPNIKLIEPVAYDEMIKLVGSSILIVTDSGGLQEEAAALGKPLLVLRDNTERPEAITHAWQLLGTKKETIIRTVRTVLNDPLLREGISNKQDAFGDGKAATRIVDWIVN